MRVFLSVAAASLFIAGGCGTQPAPRDLPAPPPLATIPPPVAPTPAVVPAPALPATETVKAETGVGIKGRSLDEYEGVYVTPAKALLAFRESNVFNILIPKNVSLFQATEGRLPKSHEEFMQRIIADGLIKLPELPPGHRYQWDPVQGELMVERPRPTAAP